MAKKKGKSKKKKVSEVKSTKAIKPAMLGLSHKLWMAILFAFAFLLYANTLGHDYTQDDAIVIYDNMHTQKGISGIPKILTKDSFHGFFKEDGKDKLVAGGRYRPASLIMFAIGWELFGSNPFIGHLINVLLYGFLCILIFMTLSKFRLGKKENMALIALLSAFIYACHPIHTEVVANIKGRDEILSMLGSMLALYWTIKSHETGKMKWSIFAGLVFFLSLLAKENTITFLAVVPAALYFFKGVSLTKALAKTLPLLLGAITFIGVRSMILGFDFGGTPMEYMNNPFLVWTGSQYEIMGFGQKLANIFVILGKYLQLLFFPHPLTHDYYPKQILASGFGDPSAILSMIMYVSLILFGFLSIKKNKLIAFSIFYFIATISIVSNIVFPIGTNLSERFLFMPSLGFALIIGYVLSKLSHKKTLLIGTMSIICALFSMKTISRNFVWKNDYTLFTTDALVSTNSAKVNNAAAGAITTEYFDKPESPERTEMLQKAKVFAARAVELHPTYGTAYLISGNCNFYLNDHLSAEKDYFKALEVEPNLEEAKRNMAINDRKLGQYYGEEKNDIPTALRYLKRAESYLPDDYETVRLLGIAYGNQGTHSEAIKYFSKAVKLKPDFADSYRNLGIAYQGAGNEVEATKNFLKANELDANAPK